MSLAACLPPIAGNTYDPDKCSLTYRPPPPLAQDVKITDCSFVSRNFLPGALREGATLIQCSVFNGSHEAIESIRYGVRYMEDGRKTPLLEAGFQGPARFSTRNISGGLQPGEKSRFPFAAPGLPKGVDAAHVVPVIEVLGVHVPGSLGLR